MFNNTALTRRLRIANFDLYIHATPEDGHCMLHALAQAISPTYQTGMRDGKPVSRLQIVKEIRSELLTKLAQKNSLTGVSNYQSIGNGSFAQSAQWNETTTPKYLKQVLSGSAQLGEEVKLILEFFIEKNILLLDARSNRLYAKYGFNPKLSTVVLYHSILGKNEVGEEIGHFQLISLLERNKHVKHFPSQHPFVQYLLNN